MNNQVLLCEKKGQTAWLTMNRPESLNAINRELSASLVNTLLEVDQDDSVRVIVLTGNGSAFSVGGDLKDALAETVPGEDDLFDGGAKIFELLRNTKKPVIAAVNGIALAGGLELILACDLVYAAEGTKLGDGHANYGVFPAAGGAAILSRLIPMCEAKRLLFTGDYVDAENFKRWGLINDVVPADSLFDEVQKVADSMLKNSPLAIGKMKQVVNYGDGRCREDALNYELLEFNAQRRSYDMSEGLDAFTNKRKPEFKGY